MQFFIFLQLLTSKAVDPRASHMIRADPRASHLMLVDSGDSDEFDRLDIFVTFRCVLKLWSVGPYKCPTRAYKGLHITDYNVMFYLTFELGLPC